MHRHAFQGRCALALALAMIAVAFGVLPGPAAANPVQTENSLTGNPGWATRALAPASAIEGYSRQASAAPGEVVDFRVHAAALARYRVEIYRLGWYGGDGARLMTCLPSCTSDKPAVTQSAAPAPDP